MVVARGGQNLKHAVGEVEDGDVEGAAAQVEDQDALVGALLVQAIGKSSSGRLVDDTLDVEASDLAGVLGGLTLGVVEVGRDGDDASVTVSPRYFSRRPSLFASVMALTCSAV